MNSELTELRLQPEYRSDANDLVHDFYVPCLQRSRLYRRAVGFFTSRGLSVAAQGNNALIRSGGQMSLVASPLFDDADLDAIRRGYSARDDVMAKALLRQIEDPEDNTIRDRLGYLSWLIAEERLDVRIAIPLDEDGIPRRGIYHEKLGIFSDAAENTVAFTGSPNETAGGLVDNFETVDVFWSWDDQQGRVARKIQNFDRLWKNETQQLRVIAFPDAVREKLLRYRPARPDLIYEPETPVPTLDRWRHQDEAVDAFVDRERGIIEMATGTGKTRTALRIASRLIDSRQVDTVIVAADGNDLLDQWYEQLTPLCAQLDPQFAVVRHYGPHKDREHFVLDPNQTVLLASRQFIPPALRALDADYGRRTLLVHDEVHRLGSPSNRLELAGLSDSIRFRLGLSATPEREYDADGTAFIEQHIGPVIYRFELEDAIARGILSPFEYHPIEWSPSSDDRQRIQQVYKRVAARQAAGDPMSQAEIWIELARIYKTSQVKIPLFRQFVADNSDLLRRSIIFVETKDYGDEVLRIVHQHRHDFHTYFAEDQSQTLRRFARGELECLITCHRLSEGIDIQSLQTVILLSSDRARLETIQRIGRCLRTDPANPTKVSHVVDFVRLHDGDDDDAEPTPDEARRDWLLALSQIRPEVM
ncbi:MAG: hypothetical protein DWQ29_04810 [Planctomycetota bacterium]|nr:MAG: hypothetical protein DWQ29_04810 [Planctomycetota bacterium]